MSDFFATPQDAQQANADVRATRGPPPAARFDLNAALRQRRSEFDPTETFHAAQRGIANAVSAAAGVGELFSNLPNTALSTPSYLLPSDPIMRDAVRARTDPHHQDQTPAADYFANIREAGRQAVRAITPDPATLSQSQQIISGVAEGLAPMLATIGLGATPSIAAFAGAGGVQTYDSLRDQGVDERTAFGAAAQDTALNAAAGVLPVSVQGRLWARALSGAALGAGVGAAQRRSMNSYLTEHGYGDIARQYQWLDPTQTTIDAIMGAAFGGLFGHRPAPRVRDIENPDGSVETVNSPPRGPDEWLGDARQYATDGNFAEAYAHALIAEDLGHPDAENLRTLIEEDASEADLDQGRALANEYAAAELGDELPGSEISDAAMVQADAIHREVTSAPGVPADGAARAAHAEALDMAQAQASRDEPISVEATGVENQDFVTREDRDFESEAVIQDAVREALQESGIARDLAEADAQLRAMQERARERGLDPDMLFSFGGRGRRLKFDEDEAVRLAEEGVAASEIAARVGGTTSNVRAALRRRGIELPRERRTPAEVEADRLAAEDHAAEQSFDAEPEQIESEPGTKTDNGRPSRRMADARDFVLGYLDGDDSAQIAADFDITASSAASLTSRYRRQARAARAAGQLETLASEWGVTPDVLAAFIDKATPRKSGRRGGTLQRLLDAMERSIRAGKRPSVSEMAASLNLTSANSAGVILAKARRAARGGDTGRAIYDPKDLARLREIDAKAAKFSFGSDPFYSGVARALERINTARAPAAQWWATLSKAAGVKKEELEWIGLEDWLTAQSGPIARDDVLAFVQAHGVQVEETVLGARSPEDEARQRELLPLIEERDRLRDQMPGNTNDPAWRRLSDQMEVLSARISELSREAMTAAGRTRWSEYTLPGGENYRELLLRLPTLELDALNAEHEALQTEFYALADRTSARGREIFARLKEVDEAAHGRTLEQYRSSHFDEPNILAHVRFNERVSADGKRTLFIEEVQSDWHQAGRERGYQGDENPADAALIEQAAKSLGSEDIRNGADLVAAYRKGYISNIRDDALRAALDRATSRRVPNAPFKNNAWAALAMKRMIRWAAENGFEQIAWTQGRHQIARFSLAKRFTSLDLLRNTATGEETLVAHQRRNDVGQSFRLSEDTRLESIVGSEIAAKLRSVRETPAGTQGEGTTRSISGVDLEIGGEGMKAFYDRILPNIANDLGKKFGARVGETRVMTALNESEYRVAFDAPSGEWAVVDRSGEVLTLAGSKANAEAAHAAITGRAPETVHALPLTPELRDMAMEGQALFSQGGRGMSSVDALQSLAVDQFGASWAALSKAAFAEIVPNASGLPFAAPDGAVAVHYRGKSYFIADRISPENLKGLILHEIGVHHGMKLMLGARGWQAVLKSVDDLAAANHPAALEARAAAEAAGGHPDNLREETLAYLVEQNADLPLVNRLLSQVRQWLVKTFGTTFGLKLTVEDIRALALASLRQVAREAERAGDAPTPLAAKSGSSDLMASRRPRPTLKEVDELKAKIAALETELRTDALTGLRNLRAFEEDEALGWPMAGALDMDGLKRLNDTLGHEAGDMVLKELAGVLLKAEAADVRFYRRSGDEFAARFRNRDDAEAVMADLQTRLENITVTFTKDGVDYDYQGIGASVGHGANYDEADARANEDKARRLASGQREEARAPGPPRRVHRSGMVEDRRPDNQRALGEPGRRIGDDEPKYSFGARKEQDAYSKLSPEEQALADNPDMRLPLESGIVVARDALESAENEAKAAREMGKGYEAAAKCAARHGGDVAARSVGRALSRDIIVGQGLGLTLGVPVGYGASLGARAAADYEAQPLRDFTRRRANLESGVPLDERGMIDAPLVSGPEEPSPPVETGAGPEGGPVSYGANPLTGAPLSEPADAPNPDTLDQ